MNGRDSIEESRFALESLRPDESQLAFRDELTGLYNRRLFSHLMDEKWETMTSLIDRFSLLMIDLDLFKEINDRYGHLSGDDVLREMGALLRMHFRKGDLVFRYGGDEFIVLLPGAGIEEADALAHRARDAVIDHDFHSRDSRETIDVELSFCVGSASYPEDGTDPDAILAKADARLYEQKRIARLRRRKRRRLIWQLATTFLLALLVVLTLLLWRRDFDPETAAAPPAPIATVDAEAERNALLDQIEVLQEQIQSMERNRPAPAESPGRAESPELAQLRAQIIALTRELDARVAPSTETSSPPNPSPGPAEDPSSAAAPLPLQSEPRARVEQPTPEHRVEPSIVMPRLLEAVTPRYPALARDMRREATIEMIVLVDPNGKVVHARIVGRREGFGFEKAAMDAALQSRWQPGARNGHPVEMETPFRVIFKIPER